MERFSEEEIALIEEMTELEYLALIEFIASVKRLRACRDYQTAV